MAKASFGAKMMMGAASGVSAGASLDAEILALSPAGYWRLDETSGTTAADSSGNGRNGTYAGSYTLNDETGLDGDPTPRFVSGGVIISDNADFRRTASGGITVFALVKPDGVAVSRQFVITKGGSGSTGYEWDVYVNLAKLSTFSYTTAGSVRSGTTSTADVFGAGTWTAVASYITSEAQGADIKLYADSFSVLSESLHSPTSPDAVSSTGQLYIGRRSDFGAADIVGNIARVAIFVGEVDLTDVFAAAAAEGWF